MKMSLPIAWGILEEGQWKAICDSESDAEMIALCNEEDCEHFKLIPEESVENVVAQALADDRERCRRIADAIWDIAIQYGMESGGHHKINTLFLKIASGEVAE